MAAKETLHNRNSHKIERAKYHAEKDAENKIPELCKHFCSQQYIICVVNKTVVNAKVNQKALCIFGIKVKFLFLSHISSPASSRTYNHGFNYMVIASLS